MGLIMDILKKAQQPRLKGADETPAAGHPPLNKQKKGSSKKKWSFISAGLVSLCILSFVLLKTYIPPSSTQPDRAIVPGEAKPTPSRAQEKPPEPLNRRVDLAKDHDSLHPDQAPNHPDTGREDQEKLFRGGAASSGHPYQRGKEKERHENKLSLSKKNQTPLIKQTPQEETSSKFIGEEREGEREMDFPIGTVISQGNVKMEVKDKVWRTLESPYSPILRGKKIRIENGTTSLLLSNNSLIEVSPDSLLSFEHEGRLNLLEGGIHFKIPTVARMNFKIGALSVTKPHPVLTQEALTTAMVREEETEGFLFLHPDGSLRVRSVQGALSILDRENNVLTTTSSNEPITITPKVLSGKEPWRVEQRAGVPAPEMEEKFPASRGNGRGEADELEKYLIEFSIHLKGKALPANLDAERFFSLLETTYPHPDIIEKVKQYPVKVRRKGESYVLVLCDKQSEWRLYEDLGETTHMVDHIYDPEERKVRCREAIPLYWFLTVPAAAVTTGVVWYEVDKHNDHKDTIPLCP